MDFLFGVGVGVASLSQFIALISRNDGGVTKCYVALSAYVVLIST
jgi:hypothetical protein